MSTVASISWRDAGCRLSEKKKAGVHNQVRKERVVKRNIEKGETYSFEVTPMMFDFMEKEFQRPTDDELERAIIVEQQP